MNTDKKESIDIKLEEPTDEHPLNEIISFVYDKLAEMFSAENFTPSDIINVAIQTMLILKDFYSLDGNTKKEVAIESMKRLAEKTILEPDKLNIAKTLIQDAAPVAIDSVFWASTQKIEFNPNVGCFKSCLGKCVPCIKIVDPHEE